MSERETTRSPDVVADPLDARLVELVSYLDGELDEPDSDRLERQLSTDPPLRSYVETLDRTWRLLDSLDDARASGEFTQRTIASINAIPAESSTEQLPIMILLRRSLKAGPWLRLSAWVAAGFLGTTVGLLLARNAPPTRSELDDRRLLNDMEFLQQYRTLRPIPNATFLRQVTEQVGQPADQSGEQP